MKKVCKIGAIIFSIIVIIGGILFFIPVKKIKEIKYEHEFDDGGIVVEYYYNAFGIKINEKK